MKLRAPAYPLITVDPFFSVWSPSDRLTDSVTVHWTGHPNTIDGIVTVDGTEYKFMGGSDRPAMRQISVDVNALSTKYMFEGAGIALTVTFTTPLLPYDMQLLSRPVSYMKPLWKPIDGGEHDVCVRVDVSEEICLNERGQYKVSTEILPLSDKVTAARMGSEVQKPLNRSGDDVRIDWGYFYLAVMGDESAVTLHDAEKEGDMTYVSATGGSGSLFMFAYDDIDSLIYFGQPIKAYWKKGGAAIEEEILRAAAAYEDYLFEACETFSRKLFCDAVEAGGEKYAEMLELAYRQVIAGHKIATDTDGETVFISKECFSNGCAATVDVSYPSIPMFLLYAPELVRGMMRPIFKYAASDAWSFDFAPHDAGQYPLVNGQVYAGNDINGQMPVEECGNMLIMAAAVSIADRDAGFALAHRETLERWVRYLIEFGEDPANQLCTDDFAGHLAHNCNLSLKAVMGIAGYAQILRMAGDGVGCDKYMTAARDIAAHWVKTAANGDGSYRLAFDRPGTFSMKYNMVWDKLFGTQIFPSEVVRSETASNFAHVNPYGMPLDNRATYTKSDWLMWTATMLPSREDFESFITPLWMAYNYSPSRVPLTDWYDTVTSVMVGFRHRTVQGGLFIKLLDASGKMRIN
ncbi:MAG: DUF4965 domain-containing protein [Eubacteriales bacterium]